eukprot:Clim_evm9s11 gene=Clim_evmTU9s11
MNGFPRPLFVSSACNRLSGCLDWIDSDDSNYGRNYIAYGSEKAVLVLDAPGPATVSRGIKAILHGHKQDVTTVRWHRPGSGHSPILLSASADGIVRFWVVSESHGNVVQECSGELLSHEDVVSDISSVVINRAKSFLVGSCGGDGKILLAVVQIDTDGTCTIAEDAKYEIRMEGLTYPYTLAICGSIGNGKKFLVAASTLDSHILLYTAALNENGTGIDMVKKTAVLRGHKAWIPQMCFSPVWNGEILLASASQDNMLRLWHIRPKQDEDKSSDGVPQNDLERKLNQLAIKAKESDIGEFGSREYVISIEAVLAGHDGWVTGVRWIHPKGKDLKKDDLRILTASMDRTMMIWAPEMVESAGSTNTLWTSATRVGEMGGNTLGFYGCCASTDASVILAAGYHGALHAWGKTGGSDYVPIQAHGGHFGPVTDLSWEPEGRYLLTCSSDQTTRLFSYWPSEKVWSEFARPQVHGHDLTCVAAIDGDTFASGAEEKVIRTFVAGSSALTLLENVGRCTPQFSRRRDAPLGAHVPALGLSNKAVLDENDEQIDESKNTSITNAGDFSAEDPAGSHFTYKELKEPPLEEHLIQNTLWAETSKLYGHGYELVALAASQSRKILASSCRATKSEHATIRLWNVATGAQVGNLSAHNLTIVQLCFSPDDRYLLAVSRDRHVSVHRRKNAVSSDGGATPDSSFDLVAREKAHSRIIWTCAWCHRIVGRNLMFATGSRDKTVAIFIIIESTNDGDVQCEKIATYTADHAVTAMDFAPVDHESDYDLLAIGLESGHMTLLKLHNGELTPLLSTDDSTRHEGTVKRLAFQPNRSDSSDSLLLASCGNDHTTRLYKVDRNSL